MIILDATTKKLQCVMGEAMTTTNPDYTLSYSDNTTTTFVPAGVDGTMNGLTAVDVCPAPAANTQREVVYICINNVDTVSHTFTFKYNDNGTVRVLLNATLAVNDTLQYTMENGWIIINNYGNPKVESYSSYVGSGSQFFYAKPNAANLTSAIGSTPSAALTYLGQASKVSSTLTLQYRITTAAVTITFCEFAIYKGNFLFNVNNNATVTTTNPGFSGLLAQIATKDCSAIWNSTGIKTTAITLTTPTAIGDHIYVEISCTATTGANFRSSNVTNDLMHGDCLQISSGHSQPSVNPHLFNQGGTPQYNQGTTALWVAGYLT